MTGDEYDVDATELLETYGMLLPRDEFHLLTVDRLSYEVYHYR